MGTINYSRKVAIDFDVSHFKIQTVSSLDKLKKVLELRSLCFGRTFEINSFELQADHLVIEDLSQNSALVGAYRLTPWAPCIEFETGRDFDTKTLLLESRCRPEDRLEVDWACTSPEYREGHVIHLLWRGLSRYVKISGSKILFGPASVKSHPGLDLGEISQFIKAEGRELYKGLGALTSTHGHSNSLSLVRRKIPPLLRAYLLAGAFVFLQPIFDPDTSCYDYLTVLDIENSSDMVRSHFQI